MRPLSPWKLCHAERAWVLLALGLLAVGVAFVLSPPGMDAWAWYQSPVSPVSPISPVLTQTPASTVPAITPTSASETPSPSEAQPPQDRGRATTTLVMGGIVLIGLIAGAVVLLVRGQPPDESAPR